MILCLIYLPLKHVLASINAYYILIYRQIQKINALFYFKDMHPYFKAMHSCVEFDCFSIISHILILGIDDSPDTRGSV